MNISFSGCAYLCSRGISHLEVFMPITLKVWWGENEQTVNVKHFEGTFSNREHSKRWHTCRINYTENKTVFAVTQSNEQWTTNLRTCVWNQMRFFPLVKSLLVSFQATLLIDVNSKKVIFTNCEEIFHWQKMAAIATKTKIRGIDHECTGTLQLFSALKFWFWAIKKHSAELRFYCPWTEWCWHDVSL